jgi:hypothetical protein
MSSNEDSPLPAGFKERLLAAAKEKASPPRHVVRLRQAVMLAGAFLVAVVPYFVFNGPLSTWISPTLTAGDIAHGMTRDRPESLMAWTSGGSFLISMAVVWLALSRGRSMLGRKSNVLLAVMVLTPIALFAWRYGWSQHYDFVFTWGSNRAWWGSKCLRMSLAIALAPMTAFLALRRGSDPNNPAITGAVMGVSAGACSWVLVDMQCPVGAPMHLLIGHVLPILILGVVGAVLGRWILAVRPITTAMRKPD